LLRDEFERDIGNEDFELCLTTLNDMIELSKGNDNYAQEQIIVVNQYIEVNTLIDDAIELSNQKDFNSALVLLDEAIEIIPEYEKLLTRYDEVKNKKDNYNSYITKIDNINHLNQNGDYLNAYNQANNLLNNDTFVISVEVIIIV